MRSCASWKLPGKPRQLRRRKWKKSRRWQRRVQQAANVLEFDEATTRARIIDSLLATAGWNVGSGDASTAEVGKEVEVQHQPTESGLGYADYVLWDDNGNPLAVIEAKKTSVDPELVGIRRNSMPMAWKRCTAIVR